LKLQLIVWQDHWSDDATEWKDVEEEQSKPVEPLVCHSVGWVLREDAKMVSLISNLDGTPAKPEERHGYGVTHILKAAIVRRVTLRNKL